MELVKYIISNATEFISNGGVLMGFFLVFLESLIPALPLSLFVALNVNAFGYIYGIIISWLGTITGSYLVYRIFYTFEDKFHEKILSKKVLSKISLKIDKFSKIKLTSLVLIFTLPFTPSSLINILGGVSRVSRLKFIISLIIGKTFSIIFWGYIGKSLIESLTDLKSIIYVIITLVIAYIISKIISKRMNIE